MTRTQNFGQAQFQHEQWVESLSKANKMQSTRELTTLISNLLTENKYYFDNYGPHSKAALSDPASSAYVIWVARRLDTILPNNRKILSALDVNGDLIPPEMHGDVLVSVPELIESLESVT